MDTGLSTIWDVLPIVVIIFVFQFLDCVRPIANPVQVLVGFIYVLVGLTAFWWGCRRPCFPSGRFMARQLTGASGIQPWCRCAVSQGGGGGTIIIGSISSPWPSVSLSPSPNRPSSPWP
ncbi:MAG: DUF1538 family protein [Gammaproteobacteria bacterium]|nr:DUF1538 family protein [Gammaproteobacteria bacterium]